MGNLLNFTLSLTDLLGPKLAALADRVASFGREVEKPHKVRVDTSQAEGGLGKLAGFAGKAFAALAVFDLGKKVVGMGAGMEQTRVQFETFTGSVEKGNAVIAKLQKFALDTPFEDEQVISAGRGLLAFGESADSLEPTLVKLGNISSATGKDFNELVSIWGKNKLSGIIQGEDLNQLNDSGIPVMESLSKQLGVNISQVRKMGADGKITFQMLDKAFDELGGPAGKWGDLMEKQSQTLAGRWSSLVGFAQNMGAKMGEALVPFMGKIVESGNTLLAFVQGNGDKLLKMFDPLREALKPLLDAFAQIYEEMGITGDTGTLLQNVFNGLATVFNFISPVIKTLAEGIGAIYLRVWHLIEAVGKFIETSPRLQKFFSGLWEAAKTVFDGIVKACVTAFDSVADILEGVFTLNWDKVKSGLGKALDVVGDQATLGMKAADSFLGGYEKGFDKSVNLFEGDKKPATPDQALANMGKKPAAMAPGMAAAAAKGSGTGASGSGQIKQITIRMNNLVQTMNIHAATVAEGADEIADLVLRKLASTLNDVNTLAAG